MARVLTLPVTVPTLDELAADPEQATSLPRPAIQALLHRCVAVQAILLGALAVSEPDRADSQPDRLLDVTEAANRLGMSPDWLYRHASKLPFVKRQGRTLRFSNHAIDAYIRSRS